MENIKLGLFDIFGFIFPGFLALFAISLPFVWDISLADLSRFFGQLQGIPFTLLILFVSYIVGASIHQIGYYWYYLMVMIIYYRGLRIFLQILNYFYKIIIWIFTKAELKSIESSIIQLRITALDVKHTLLDKLSNISENYILIRQFTPNQISALDEWTSKRAMSFNLSLSFLVLIFTSNYILKKTNNTIWLIIEVFSILSTVSLLIRAYGYDFWWKKELEIIVDKFDLKVKKIDAVSNNPINPPHQG